MIVCNAGSKIGPNMIAFFLIIPYLANDYNENEMFYFYHKCKLWMNVLQKLAMQGQ
jgi:hypothetical protein